MKQQLIYSLVLCCGIAVFSYNSNAQAIINARPLKLFSSGAPINSITLQGPTSYSSAYTLTMPAAAPALNQLLISDGSGNLSWGLISNANISGSAAIDYSKLNLVNSIQNSDIVANAITTSKVANGTVTTSKLADSAVSGLKLLTNAVVTNHIANGAVSLAKISSAGASSGNVITYDGANVVWGSAGSAPSGPAGGDLSGTYPNPQIASGVITNTEVNASAAIAYSKLALSNSIQNSDIVANAITTSKVANGTVTTSKMADSAISGLKLLTYAVQNRHIADAAVTAAKISGSGASSGNVLTYNGSSVVWAAPASGGVVTYSITSGTSNPISITNTSATFHRLDFGATMGSGTTITISLASASSYSAGTQLSFFTSCTNSGGTSPTVTLQTTGGESIYNFTNGASTSMSMGALSLFSIMSDGTNWYRVP